MQKPYGFSAAANFRFAYPQPPEKIKASAGQFLKNFALSPYLWCSIPLAIVGASEFLNDGLTQAWKIPSLYAPLACMGVAITCSAVDAINGPAIEQCAKHLEKVKLLKPVANVVRDRETFPLLGLMASSVSFGVMDFIAQNAQGFGQMELFTITYGSIYLWMKNGGFVEACRDLGISGWPKRRKGLLQSPQPKKEPVI